MADVIPLFPKKAGSHDREDACGCGWKLPLRTRYEARISGPRVDRTALTMTVEFDCPTCGNEFSVTFDPAENERHERGPER